MASASYPDVSLSLFSSLAMKICAQGKAGRRKRARCASPPFFTASHGSLRLVTSHSRFALALIRNHAKNEAPEEEAGMAWFARNDPLYQYSSGTLIKRVEKSASLHRDGFSIRLSLGLELFASLLLFASHKRLIHKPVSRWRKARLPGSCISPRMAVQLRSS